MELKIDISDIVHWGRVMGEVPKITKVAATHALNSLGQEIVHYVSRAVAEDRNVDPEEILRNIIVYEADPHDLTWIMDATAVARPESALFDRPFPDREETTFDQDTLVNIVTMDDGYDCDVCQQVAEQGPYTMEQVNDMQAKWAEYIPPTPNIAPGVITNLVHPRCRCVTQAWQSYRRLPVSFVSGTDAAAGGGGGEPMPQTARQLSRKIVEEMRRGIEAARTSLATEPVTATISIDESAAAAAAAAAAVL